MRIGKAPMSQPPWIGSYARLAQKIDVDSIGPSDPRYANARLVYNRFHDLYPAALVRTRKASAIAEILRFAADNNVPLAVRGGGHHIAGFGSCDGGIVIDFSPFREVSLNPNTGLVEVEPGVRLGDLDRHLAARGLVVPTGTVSDTGIAGLTLGGGIGWLVGRNGLTCDQLVGADVVLADGSVARAEDPHHEDLLWALRGGGGNFGVVTQFRYAPSPLPQLIVGSGTIGLEGAADALERLVGFLETSCPRTLTVAPAFFRNARAEPRLSIDFCLSAAADRTLDSLMEIVGPASWKTWRNVEYWSWQSAFDRLFLPPMRGYWKSRYSKRLSRSNIDTLVDAFARSSVARSAILIEHLHGAFVDTGTEASSFPLRWARFGVLLSARWRDRTQDESAISWVRETFSRLDPNDTSAAYSNYTGADDPRALQAFESGLARRLISVKVRYDLENVFRRNHNVKPNRRSTPDARDGLVDADDD
ncbi:MAG: FAD-binding protein [Pyrinomonadaceae bacterium]